MLLVREGAVVEDDDDHAEAVARGGLELLEHEAEGPVAGEAQDALVGRGQLGPDARGQGPPDAAEAAGRDQPPARASQGQPVDRPQRAVAGVRADDGVVVDEAAPSRPGRAPAGSAARSMGERPDARAPVGKSPGQVGPRAVAGPAPGRLEPRPRASRPASPSTERPVVRPISATSTSTCTVRHDGSAGSSSTSPRCRSSCPRAGTTSASRMTSLAMRPRPISPPV